MASLENVERLRQRADISYDEAKTALDASGDDLLEAMIYLERLGRVPPPPAGHYSTQGQDASGGGGADAGGQPPRASGFKDTMGRLWRWMVGLVKKGNANHFEVWRREERSLSLPITVLVILLLCCFWVVVPLLVVGLFCGCTYRVSGPQAEQTAVNNVMDSAAKAAENLKSEVISATTQGEGDQ